jgi:CubicO group peptidase (beta-lactamase class C family)
MENFRPFILPCVGLFWVLAGVQILLRARKERRQAAVAGPASETTEAGAAPRAKRTASRSVGLFWIGVGFATLWFSGLHIGAAPAVAQQTVEPQRENETPLSKLVTREVEREFEQQSHVGLVVGVVAEGEELLLGFGTRRVGETLPTDADTVFEIGSITKTFTGILLAQRVESGDLALDDRAGELLPDGWSLSDAARNVTLKHLTTHTSGFPRLPANLLGVTRIASSLLGGDPYRTYSEAEFRDALATVELEFEPGSDHGYSNFAVGLLGFILATKSQTDYETLAKREIFTPLGMEHTVITNGPWQNEHLATGYRGTSRIGPGELALESSPWQLPNHLAGAGGIRSTGGDMLRYLKANMGLLPTPLDAAIQRSHQELHQESADRAMGMNWVRSFDEPIGQKVIWHNGGTGGFKSYLGFTVDRKFGVVVLANSSHDVDELGEEILEELVEESAEEAGR